MPKPIGNALALRELATPAGNPPAGTRWFYIKSDGSLYTKNSSGVEAVVAGGGGASTLDGLTDVNAPSPLTGQVLTFDGTAWVADGEDAFTSSIYGYGGTTTAKNAVSPALIDLDYLGPQDYVALTGGNSTRVDASPDFVPQGDVDIRVKMTHPLWRAWGGGTEAIFGQWTTVNRYILWLQSDGTIRVIANDSANVRHDQPIGYALTAAFKPGETGWIRVTIDINNGAGAAQYTLYTSTDGTTWTQRGVANAPAGVIPGWLTAAGTPQIGVYNNSTAPTRARVHRLQVLDGVDGPLLADFNATDFPDKASASVSPTVIDSTGRSWTLQGDAKAHTRKALWLPGTTGNYVSTPDKNELDYESSTFETSVGTWEGINKNLLTANQSSAETDTTGWTVAGSATLARTTAQAFVGTASFSVTATAANDIGMSTAADANGTHVPGIIPLGVYTISAHFKAGSTPRAVRFDYAWNNSSNTRIGAYVTGPVGVADNSAGWTQYSVVVQAPAGAASIQVVPVIVGCASGEVHYIDALSVMETPNANLVPNSDFETALRAGLWSGSGGTAVSRSTEQAYVGTASLKVVASTSATTTDTLIVYSDYVKSPVGTVTTHSAYVFSSVATTARMNVQHDNAAGSAIISTERGTVTNVPANTWTRISCTATVPAGGGNDRVEPGVALAANASCYVDAVQTVVGSAALPYLPPATTNLCPNPSFEVDLTGWSPTRGTSVRVTTQSSAGNASLEYTSNDASGGNYVHNSPRVPIVGGRIYTVSAYMKGDGGTAQAAQIVCYYYDATGAQVGGADTGTAANLTTSWSRRSVIAMPPSTAATMDIYLIFGNNFAVGRKAWADAVQIEFGSIATPYVDGSLGAAGYAYSALGAGYSWDSAGNLVPNPSLETDLTDWGWGAATLTRDTTQAFSGAASAKALDNNTGGDCYVTAQNFNLAPNTTYTASFYARSSVAATFSGMNGNQVFYVQESGGGYRAAGGVTLDGLSIAANTWTRFTLTFTTQSDWFGYSRIIFRVPNVAGVQLNGTNGNYWIDAVQVEQRSFPTPYGQVGTANASTSTRRHFWVAGGSSVDLISRTQNLGGREGAYEAIVGSGAAKYQTINGYQGSSCGAQTGWISASASTAYSLSLMVTTETNAEFQVIDQAGSLLASSSASSTYWSSSSRFSLAFTTLATTTNIRIRVLVKTGGSGYVYIDAVQLEKAATATAYVPPLRITGDLDVRVKVAMADWTSEKGLVGKWGTSAYSFILWLASDGRLVLSSAPSIGAEQHNYSTASVPVFDGSVLWVRATHDVDNGSGGNTIFFYTSTDGLTWTNLGAPVVVAGVHSRRYSLSAPLVVGDNIDGSTWSLKGAVVAAQVRAGIDGPIVAEMRPEEATAPGTTWTDTTDRVWTVSRSGDATAEIVARNAWAFTGSEYLTLPDRSELDFGSGEFTVVTSLARRAHSSANRILAGKLTYLGGSNAGYALTLLFNDLTPKMSISDGTNSVQATAPAALTPGVWAVVAGDRQADDKARAYVGGVAGNPSSSLAGSTDNALPFRVNAYGDTPYENFGLSNWTAVFRRTLTTAEHADLAAWDGRVTTQPGWLDEAATLLVNADEPGTRAAYRAANFVGSHFTGDTPDTDEYLYYWSGTPYASESIRVPASYARAIVPAQPEDPGGITGALWYDTDDETITQVDGSQITSGTVDLARLPVSQFPKTKTFALYEDMDDASRWIVRTGPTPTSVSISDGVGAYALRAVGGGDQWYALNRIMPFDPDALYKVTFRVRCTANGAGPNQVYAGLEGVAADGTTLVNVSGINTHGSQHYIAAAARTVVVADGWVTLTGYVKGWAATGTGYAPDPRNPAKMHSNVRYIRPMMLSDYQAGTGTYEWGLTTIDVVDQAPLDAAASLAAPYKGTFDNYTSYAKGDIVNYQGVAYVANQAVVPPAITGNDPTLTGKAAVAGSTTSSYSFVIPATVAVGDEMLLVVGNYNSSWTPTITGGSAGAWTTLAANQAASSTYYTYSHLLRKVAAAGDPGATITVAGYNTYGSADFRAYRYATYDKYAFQAQNGMTAVATPALTTTAGRGLTAHVVCSMTNSSSTNTLTVDTGLSNPQTANAPNYFTTGSGDEVRLASSGGSGSRTFTSASAGGFTTFAVSYIGTRTQDDPPFTPSQWTALPFEPPVDGAWELISTVTTTAVASQTVGNLTFNNIPTRYKKLRLVCDALSYAYTSSSHLQFRINNIATSSYFDNLNYRSTGSWTGTTSQNAYGYAGYNYFYGTGYNAGAYCALEMEFDNAAGRNKRYSSKARFTLGSTNYVYGADTDGMLNSSSQVTRIDLFTSTASTWTAGCIVRLYGSY